MKAKRTKMLLASLSALVALLVVLGSGSAAKGKDDQLQGVPEKLTNLITSLNQTLNTMRQTINLQQEDIAILKTDLVATRSDVLSLTSVLASVKSDLASAISEIASLKTELPPLQNDVAALLSQLQQIETRLTKLETNSPPASNLHKVSGVMRDVNGKLFHASIALFNETTLKYYSEADRDTSQYDTGIFEFKEIPDGTYSVVYYAGPNYAIDSPKQITVSGGDLSGLVVNLAVPVYTVAGRVLDLAGTPTLIGQTVGFSNDYGVTGGYVSPVASDGSFAIPGLAPGTYSINIGHFNAPNAWTTVTVTTADLTDIIVSPEPTNSKNLSLTQQIITPDLIIRSLSAINDQNGNISITMKYSSGEVRDFSFFSPPNGDEVMHKFVNQIGIIQDGKVTFNVPISDIQKMSEITMAFYNQNFDRNFIFLNPADFTSLIQ